MNIHTIFKYLVYSLCAVVFILACVKLATRQYELAFWMGISALFLWQNFGIQSLLDRSLEDWNDTLNSWGDTIEVMKEIAEQYKQLKQKYEEVTKTHTPPDPA